MKRRVSFFLVLIILLTGVPSLAAGQQSEFLQSFFELDGLPPGSSFDSDGDVAALAQDVTGVYIDNGYVSTDPSDPSSAYWSAPDGY